MSSHLILSIGLTTHAEISYLPVYVQAQNAGILLHGRGGNAIFDLWGLTPDNETIVEASGRIVRHFPECSASIPTDHINTCDFFDFISSTMSRMSWEGITTSKGHGFPEVAAASEDVPSPTNITELLYIELVNKGIQSEHRRICKHTREEVIGTNGSNQCWRRSPFWLFLRVTSQLILSRQDGKSILYKKFLLFFMSQVLEKACEGELQSETIHCIYSKVCRRKRKLELTEDEKWMEAVTAVLNNANEVLSQNWQKIIKRHQISLEISPFNLSAIEADTLFEIPNLNLFVKSIAHRQSAATSGSYHPVSQLRLTDKNTFASLALAEEAKEYTMFYLFAFEYWIDKHLDTWLNEHGTEGDACNTIKNRAFQYFKIAKRAYVNNPKENSAMLLRILVLWVACDKLAAADTPELKRYKPPVPDNIWSSLLLSSNTDVGQLKTAEGYLKDRQEHSQYETFVFDGLGGNQSFAVKAFESDPNCKKLLKTLIKCDKDKESEKIEELEQQIEDYSRLMQEYHDGHCDAGCEGASGSEDQDAPRTDDPCARCQSKRQALEMKIDTYEKILPKEESEKKNLVFELLASQSFSAWRDFTIFFLTDVLAKRADTTNNATNKRLLLSNYFYNLQHTPGIKKWLSKYQQTADDSRVVLSSASEPKMTTIKIRPDLTKDNILINHRHNWEYFDISTGSVIAEFPPPTLVKRCTVQLPYSVASLQRFVTPSTQQSQAQLANSVISDLQECPAHISQEEFRSLALAPLGHHTRWTNILRQLASPTIDFKRQETALIFLQISTQVGPLSGLLLGEAHQSLEDPVFVQKLVTLIQQELDRIKNNWEATIILWTLVLLLTRIVSSFHGDAVESSWICLSNCRHVAKQWMTQLRNTGYVQVENSEKESFIQKAAEVALICVATFDVGEECLLELLSAEENVAIFIECSIMIRENIHTVDPEDQLHAIWFLTWKRIAYTGLEALLNTITTTKCLDTAIGHCRNTGTLRDPQPWLVTEFHWVFTKRRIPGSTEHRRDYFNVLTAEFLVNGLPSGKLPRDIEEHEAYSTFFGHARLDVNECSEKGMQYQTVHKIHGHDVSLGLLATPESFQEGLGSEENHDFIIAATADGGCQYDLVPGRLFHKVLPNEFFEKHVHWLFRKGKNIVIEFRPKHLPWQHQDTNWVLHKEGDYWQLAEPSGGLLVDTAREASKQVTDAFASLAEPEDLHIVYFPRTKHLEVHLPRLQLEFYIEEKSSRILSRQYQGMWVDSCQDIDTLIGLHQKLVLRDERSHRLLLIPEGELNLATPEMNDTHVFVTIDMPSRGKVYAYELDTYLGKLCGRDFESILRLALLHGYTSGCVPDPFTGYTGTERALQIVRSAEINSPRAVSPGMFKLLQKIGKLSEQWKISTPKNGLKRQYIVRVNGLSPLAHHPDFAELFKQIVNRFSRYRIFEPTISINKAYPEVDGDKQNKLCIRARLRSSVFYSQATGIQKEIISADSYYYGYTDPEVEEKKGKKENTDNTDGQKAEVKSHPFPGRTTRFTNLFKVSDAMKKSRRGNYSNSFENIKQMTFLAVIRKTLKEPSTMLTSGPCEDGESIQLEYHAGLLDKPGKFFPKTWFSVCTELIHNRREINKHKASFYIATLAFSPHVVLELVHILTGALYLPVDATPPIPQAKNFDLSRGNRPKTSDLKNAVNAARISSQAGKSFRDTVRNKKTGKGQGSNGAQDSPNKTRAEYTKENTKLAEAFMEQWGRMEVQWPKNHDDLQRYYNKNKVISNVETIFRQASDNAKVDEHFKNWHGIIYSKSQKYKIDLDESRSEKTPQRTTHRVDHRYVFQVHTPPAIPSNSDSFLHLKTSDSVQPSSQVFSLVQRLQKSASTPYQVAYSRSLDESRRALERAKGELLLQASWREFQPQILRRRNEAKKEFEDHLLGIKKALLRGSLPQNSLTELSTAAIQPNLPRVCTHFLVEQLASNEQLPLQWKRELAIFATRLSKWQNWDRLLLLPGTAHKDALKQLHGLKPRTWDPMMHPEWLVFEVENNLSIRDIQVEFANAMMNPPNRQNSIMQLNMGEGKSSVIVPIIATSLCRKGNLVRLIVTRSQFAQMSQIMTARLGGLLGRRIYHLPISRNMTLTEASVGKLHKIIQDCVESKGILIVQPEQILSLDLMISDYSSKCSEKAREVLYDIKHLLDDSCRDIVDESDDVFSPRYELVYPLGKEQPIDFARERCSIISQILTIACKKAEAILEEMPGGLVISPMGPGRYPKLSLVTREASKLLERRIAEEICLNGLIGFSISQTSSFSTYKEKILEFWTNRALKETTREFIEKDLCWAPQMTSFLYLIRGLIACGVLSAALRDRFRVNYGLDKARMPKTDLAVPYRAKDTPSVGSEYSQPDTVITKTYLAYYYDGLNDRDLTETLMHLLQSDRSHIEYQEWVKAAPDLPKAWHDVKGINLEDTQLCKRDLFPHLRSLRVCIDYYLSYIVFPKQLREYSEKISASGWDIGRFKELVTTGFSGTHDLKPLLPLTMGQQDLISQAHTDALVLEKMLGLHNHTHFLDPPNSTRISEDFLQKITTQEPDIRVIIDVGAYLIDLTNEQVARTWLGILQGRNVMIDAAIYCDDNGDLTVLDRHGKTESLQLSPFARQMERCVVFLDEAHSRGTDLKLPSTCKAAVTLGRNLTKDKLAQGNHLPLYVELG